jgi:hypothetical protein
MDQKLNDPYGLDLLGDLFACPMDTGEMIINDGELYEEYPRQPKLSDRGTATIG